MKPPRQRTGRRGRGGQGGHESRTRIRTRELRALELANQGWSQHQIAADLGISQAAVSKLLKRVELRILRELADTVERQKARQSLRLEHLFAESMRAWTDSQSDATRRRQRKSQGGKGGDATVAEVTVENQHGDPRYLEEARKALADHRKIWGLDAPQKVDVRATRNPYVDMSDEELRTELDRQSRLLAAANAAVTKEGPTPIQQEPDHAHSK
jgi:transcriptional regulator with XRE-family HTH domain